MTEYRVLLPEQVLAEAETFLTERGSHGVEGTGLIACARAGAGGPWVARRFVAPDQRGQRVGLGCWVEVTDAGKRELASTLGRDERYLVRLHSHPGEAFHSSTDDENPALTFIGALSIVAPYFGLGLRRGLDACATFRLTPLGWRPIDSSRREWLRTGAPEETTW
ncbi:hypothetical protein [Amycolatopsis sp. NPDC003861]